MTWSKNMQVFSVIQSNDRALTSRRQAKFSVTNDIGAIRSALRPLSTPMGNTYWACHPIIGTACSLLLILHLQRSTLVNTVLKQQNVHDVTSKWAHDVPSRLLKPKNCSPKNQNWPPFSKIFLHRTCATLPFHIPLPSSPSMN